MDSSKQPKQGHEGSYIRFPAYLFLLMFLTITAYTAGSIYWIIKKDNEVEKYRRIELDLNNQIKEKDQNLHQIQQRIEQLERRVEIFDAVQDLSHASVGKPAQKKIAMVVDDTSEKFGFDPYLLLAIMSTESTLRPWVHSNQGARGLMQLMPSTGRSLAELVKEEPRLIGLKDGEDLPELTIKDIESNIQLGTLYLTQLMVKYHSLEEAIYAYNLGPTLYDKRKSQGGSVPRRYYKKIVTTYNELTKDRRTDNTPMRELIAMQSQ